MRSVSLPQPDNFVPWLYFRFALHIYRIDQISSSLLDAKGEIINLHIHLGISYVTQINGTAVNHMSKGVSIEKANFQIYDK